MTEARSNPGAPRYEFVNGLWLAGDRFERRIFYSVDGILREQAPATVDSVIDLADMYVIPPFGDAHNHQLDSPGTLEPARTEYITEGTFYVQVLSNRRTSADKVRDQFNHPCTLDVTYAVDELMHRGDGLNTLTYRPIEVYTVVAFLYFTMTYATARIMNAWETRLRRRRK